MYSHLLLSHNVKCKSALPKMFLYFLVTKTKYQSDSTTPVARPDDYFSLRRAVHLPENAGCYKHWRVMLSTTLESLLPEKCQKILSALYSEENKAMN